MKPIRNEPQNFQSLKKRRQNNDAVRDAINRAILRWRSGGKSEDGLWFFSLVVDPTVRMQVTLTIGWRIR
jgi:hypothetical protein